MKPTKKQLIILLSAVPLLCLLAFSAYLIFKPAVEEPSEEPIQIMTQKEAMIFINDMLYIINNSHENDSCFVGAIALNTEEITIEIKYWDDDLIEKIKSLVNYPLVFSVIPLIDEYGL